MGGGDGPGGAPAMWTWSAFRPVSWPSGRPRTAARITAESSAPLIAPPRGHRAAVPCTFPFRPELDGHHGPDVTTVTPLSTTPQAGEQIIGGGKQESEKPKLSTRRLGSDRSETCEFLAICIREIIAPCNNIYLCFY